MTTLTAATRALRLSSVDALREALVEYLLACSPVRDSRDVLVGLAPFHDCARRIGSEPSVVFEQAADGVPTDVAGLAITFGKRTDITPRAFGYVVVAEPDGPAYRVGPVGGPWLERLEDRLNALLPDATKHDMEAGYEVMALWVQGLPADDRTKVLEALPAWLEEESHPWHSRAAMQMAWRVQDEPLLDAAIRHARQRGIHDLARPGMYPPWLSFDLYVIWSISQWPSDPGANARGYLHELRAGAQETSSYTRRLLGIRAWFTECFLEPGDRTRCIREGLEVLRNWQDAGLLRSGTTLLYAYFGSTPDGLSVLREVLTPEEFAFAVPKLREAD